MTESAFDGGALLATVDRVRYWRVEWIVADEGDGRWPSWYCDANEWPTTTIGRLTAKDAEIADLRRRIADLEAQLTEHAAAYTSVATAVIAVVEPEAEPAAPRSTGHAGASGRVVCPNCGKKVWPAQIDTHRCTPPPALAFGDWRCKTCQTDRFSPSIGDPSVCIHCAGAHQNGHAAGVA